MSNILLSPESSLERLCSEEKFFFKFNRVLNTRQEKVILRVFDEGLEGFKGGLNAANYQTFSGASPATATRDLLQLVNLGVFHKTGELKGTRYSLNL